MPINSLLNKFYSVFCNRDSIINEIGVKWGQKVLEISSVPGLFTKEIALKIGPEGHVYKLDYKEDLDTKTRGSSGNKKNIEFKGYKSNHIDLEDGSIDLIFLYNAFHKISDKNSIVKEFYRVLREKGILSIKEFINFRLMENSYIAIKEIFQSNNFKILEDNRGSISYFFKYIKK